MAEKTGVYTARKKDGSTYYRVSLTYRRKHISLGSFPDEEKASAVYAEGKYVLEHTETTLYDYASIFNLPFDKFIVLLNFRDNGIYFPNPIYLRNQYFEYYLSKDEILKFDRDDLFFYASHKIQKKGGYLFVSDYGSQYSILSRYNIHPFAVYGRDYQMANNDRLDYRYSNIRIINNYIGVQQESSDTGKSVYRTKIHVRGDYHVGTYDSEIEAAVAYNKAVDQLQKNGFQKAYAKNYIVSMNKSQYESVYKSVPISKKLTALVP